MPTPVPHLSFFLRPSTIWLSCWPGSAVAFGKLHGLLKSKALSLPGKNVANITMAAGSAAAAAALFTTGEPAVGLAALGATSALGGVMGAHMTASIGGARTLGASPPPLE